MQQAVRSQCSLHWAQPFKRGAKHPGHQIRQSWREQQNGRDRQHVAQIGENPISAQQQARDGQRRHCKGSHPAHAILARAHLLVPSLLKRLYRIYAGCVSRRNERRHNTSHNSQHDGEGHQCGIGRDFLRLLRNAEDLAQQRADVCRHSTRDPDPQQQPQPRSDEARNHAFTQKDRPDLAACRAECAQDPNLRPPLRHRDLECVVDDEHSNEQRERAGDVGRERVDARDGFKLRAARRGSFHLETRAK